MAQESDWLCHLPNPQSRDSLRSSANTVRGPLQRLLALRERYFALPDKPPARLRSYKSSVSASVALGLDPCCPSPSRACGRKTYGPNPSDHVPTSHLFAAEHTQQRLRLQLQGPRSTLVDISGSSSDSPNSSALQHTDHSTTQSNVPPISATRRLGVRVPRLTSRVARRLTGERQRWNTSLWQLL